jgi:hypothetical protein
LKKFIYVVLKSWKMGCFAVISGLGTNFFPPFDQGAEDRPGGAAGLSLDWPLV